MTNDTDADMTRIEQEFRIAALNYFKAATAALSNQNPQALAEMMAALADGALVCVRFDMPHDDPKHMRSGVGVQAGPRFTAYVTHGAGRPAPTAPGSDALN